MHLPPLGNIGRSVALVTRTLLIAGDSSDSVDGMGVSGPAQLRAFDKMTGKEVGWIALPAGGTSGPMTYEVGGKQMIVFAIGSREHDPQWVAIGLQ